MHQNNLISKDIIWDYENDANSLHKTIVVYVHVNYTIVAFIHSKTVHKNHLRMYVIKKNYYP